MVSEREKKRDVIKQQIPLDHAGPPGQKGAGHPLQFLMLVLISRSFGLFFLPSSGTV